MTHGQRDARPTVTFPAAEHALALDRYSFILSRYSPVHTGSSVEATVSNATSRTILSTKSNVASTKSTLASTLLLGLQNNGLSCSPCYSLCAASLAGVPTGGLELSGLVHEEAHHSIPLVREVICTNFFLTVTALTCTSISSHSA